MTVGLDAPMHFPLELLLAPNSVRGDPISAHGREVTISRGSPYTLSKMLLLHF